MAKIGICLVLALVFCACSTPVSRDGGLKRLTPGDNGREIAVRPDERFEVALPETPTSGYLWEIHRLDPGFLKMEREDYALRPEPDRPVNGARETKLFVFRALKKGETKLELRLRRPWEPPAEHLESFEITLKIRRR